MMTLAMASTAALAMVDWNTVYLTCFGVGLVLTVAAFLMGAGHFHLANLHIGHHPVSGSINGAMHAFNGFSLMAFLCWFGGTGYLLHKYSPFVMPVVLLFAIVSGLAAASLVFWFMARVLMPMEKYLEPADTEMTGVIGRLTAPVPAGGFGEILFSQNGARRSVAVRCDDGAAIEKGVEVVVMRYKRGVGYVRRWDEFEDGLMGAAPDEERKAAKD